MRPNFAGTWKLIRGESDFGFLPPPRLRVDTIEQDDLHFRVRTQQKDANGKVSVERNFTLGAAPEEIMVHGRARWIRAYWEDAELVVETNSEVSGGERQIEDRWTLDSDAQWLSIRRVHQLPGGTVRQHLRLQRCEPVPPSC